jgi:hypothetical protein
VVIDISDNEKSADNEKVSVIDISRLWVIYL